METITTEQVLATYKQARKYLNISQPTIYKLINDGKLDRVYVGTARRLKWSQLKQIANPNSGQKESTVI